MARHEGRSSARKHRATAKRGRLSLKRRKRLRARLARGLAQ
jgi:hypothetical protein